MNQGQRANRSGRTAEDVLAAVLRSHGVVFLRQQPVGLSIYGTTIVADFVVTNAADYPDGLVIESKWQDINGSVDEKFPYLVQNIRAGTYRPRRVVVVVGGGGCKPGAERWLREQVDRDLHAVFDVEAFISWVNRKLRVVVVSPTYV